MVDQRAETGERRVILVNRIADLYCVMVNSLRATPFLIYSLRVGRVSITMPVSKIARRVAHVKTRRKHDGYAADRLGAS